MSRFRYTVYHIICLQARGKQKNPFLKTQIRKRCVAPRRTRWRFLWAVSTARAKSATLKSQPKTAKSFAWECALSTDNRKPKIKPTPKARICLYLLLFYACVLTHGKHPGVSWLQIIGRSAHPTDFFVTIVTRAPIGAAERRFCRSVFCSDKDEAIRARFSLVALFLQTYRRRKEKSFLQSKTQCVFDQIRAPVPCRLQTDSAKAYFFSKYVKTLVKRRKLV